MKIKVKNDRTVIERPSNTKKIIAVVLAILVAAAGFVVYRCNTAKDFPKGTLVNGVDVGGMTAEEAKDTILKGMNTIKIKIDDDKPVDVTTEYEYGIEDTLETKIKIASIDPRQMFDKLRYNVPLTVTNGFDETAAAIKKAIPVKDGVVETQDAYIDLDKMDIIVEVYGKSLDYEKLSQDIADMRAKKPSQTEFEFKTDDYIDLPNVYAKELQAEYEFDREHLGDGMTLGVEGGGSWKLTPKQLSKVIKYSERGPVYDEKGAKKIAKKIKKEFNRDYITVDTKEGAKRIVNYVLEDKVDVDRTAESILNACQTGEKGMVCLSKNSYDELETRVEVSIKSQTCYFIKDGKVKLKTPVVTGSYKNATPPGVFKLYYKERNVVLKGPNGDGTDYESPVSYWMPFNGGIGLHDASWRGSFGGTIYQYGGSHGCVNMPVDQAGKLYDLIDAGTVVIVYE